MEPDLSKMANELTRAVMFLHAGDLDNALLAMKEAATYCKHVSVLDLRREVMAAALNNRAVMGAAQHLDNELLRTYGADILFNKQPIVDIKC